MLKGAARVLGSHGAAALARTLVPAAVALTMVWGAAASAEECGARLTMSGGSWIQSGPGICGKSGDPGQACKEAIRRHGESNFEFFPHTSPILISSIRCECGSWRTLIQPSRDSLRGCPDSIVCRMHTVACDQPLRRTKEPGAVGGEPSPSQPKLPKAPILP